MTDKIDLDALEKLANRISSANASKRFPHISDLKDASNGLTALIAELKEARGLLKPFAAMADAGDQKPKDDAVWAGQDGLRITYGDFRAARAFLARNGKGEG